MTLQRITNDTKGTLTYNGTSHVVTYRGAKVLMRAGRIQLARFKAGKVSFNMNHCLKCDHFYSTVGDEELTTGCCCVRT